MSAWMDFAVFQDRFKIMNVLCVWCRALFRGFDRACHSLCAFSPPVSAHSLLTSPHIRSHVHCHGFFTCNKSLYSKHFLYICFLHSFRFFVACSREPSLSRVFLLLTALDSINWPGQPQAICCYIPPCCPFLPVGGIHFSKKQNKTKPVLTLTLFVCR